MGPKKEHKSPAHVRHPPPKKDMEILTFLRPKPQLTSKISSHVDVAHDFRIRLIEEI